MKKFLLVLSLCFLCVGVNAEEFYVNQNGVSFTEKEYNYITEMFYDGYQDFITQYEYDLYDQNNFFNSPIEHVTSEEAISSSIIGPISPNASIFQNGRTFTMNKSCDSDCLVSLNATWTGNPTIKSWDVIGLRNYNNTIIYRGMCTVSGANGYAKTYSSPKILTNGFGYSVLVPPSGSMVVSTSAIITLSGKVYGAYEHAMSNISEANSKLYTMSAGGQGSVFLFYGAAVGKYDDVGGLSFSL